MPTKASGEGGRRKRAHSAVGTQGGHSGAENRTQTDLNCPNCRVFQFSGSGPVPILGESSGFGR